jgi:hypothetical protein
LYILCIKIKCFLLCFCVFFSFCFHGDWKRTLYYFDQRCQLWEQVYEPRIPSVRSSETLIFRKYSCMELSHSCFISWCGRCLICVICHGNSYHSILFKLYEVIAHAWKICPQYGCTFYLFKNSSLSLNTNWRCVHVGNKTIDIDDLSLSCVLKKDLLIFC